MSITPCHLGMHELDKWVRKNYGYNRIPTPEEINQFGFIPNHAVLVAQFYQEAKCKKCGKILQETLSLSS